MAIGVTEFINLKSNYVSNPFNEVELEALLAVEKMVDAEISSPDNYINNRVSFDTREVNFTLKPNSSGLNYNFNELRRNKLFDELERRYKSGGWDIKRDSDDGHGHYYDYWILTPKKLK